MYGMHHEMPIFEKLTQYSTSLWHRADRPTVEDHEQSREVFMFQLGSASGVTRLREIVDVSNTLREGSWVVCAGRKSSVREACAVERERDRA